MDDLSTWDPSPPVKAGVSVVVELIDEHGTRERMAFDVVADAAADFEAGRLGIGSLLGKAIAGKRSGSVVAYVRGDLRQVAVVEVRPAAGPAPDNAAERRQAAAERAAQEIAKTNAQIFASTFEGKWGGYNPDGMDHWDEPPGQAARSPSPAASQQEHEPDDQQGDQP